VEFNDTPVIIKGPDNKKILVVLGRGNIDTHYGSIEASEILKLPTRCRTSIGTEVLIYLPSYSDFVLNMKRGAQIIYPKDVASILLYGDIWAGSVVLEIGSGSGALTLALVLSVGDNGYVYSVDNNSKNQYRAAKTIERFLHFKKVSSRNYEFIEKEAESADVNEISRNISHIVTDIPEPWQVVNTMKFKDTIKWISYLPNISQVQLLNSTLVGSGYSNICIKEVLEREWIVKDKIVRPEHSIKGHTGFLVFADYII
jgi:tRNA (adenine57-N1/adenine58-N1)-methyltransferase